MVGFKPQFLAFIIANLVSFNTFAHLLTREVEVQTKYGVFKSEIHFNDSDTSLAIRAEEIIRNDLIKVVDYFEYVPRDTVHFNIDYKYRLTNGNARNYPTNIINLYNFPANNQEHLIVMEDWWRGLITHEFTHIIHLDQTRGYLNFGRNIFGTFAKLPVAIVPRWFTEGIAVWSESQFDKAGRLQNAMLNKELWMHFSSKQGCTRLDCLDEPGIYPNGQLSYWAGAHFISYAESLKPKTIKCIVEENSSAIPFDLSSIFERCSGKNVYELFDSFVQNYLSKYAEENHKREVMPNAFGPTVFQAGIIVDENKLFKVEKNKFSEALVFYDLDEKVTFQHKFEHPIADLAGVVRIDEESKALVVAFNDDPTFRDHNKVWKLINEETLLEESILDFKSDPSYVLPISKDEYATFTYVNNQWKYERVKFFDSDRRNLVEVNLPSHQNIVFVKKFGEQLVLKINDNQTDETVLILSDLDFKAPKKIYSSLKYFDVFLFKKNGIGIKEDNQTFFYSFIDGVVSKVELVNNLFKNTAIAVESNRVRVSLKNEIEIDPAHDDANLGKPEVVSMSDWSMLPIGSKSIDTIQYPRLGLYRPYYWFLAFGNADNLSSLGAMSSVADPMGRHTLSFSGLHYSLINKMGGSLDYLFDNDPWGIEAYFNKNFSKQNAYSDYVSEESKFEINLFKKNYMRRFVLTSATVFGNDVISDFLSKRNSKYFGGRVGVSYAANAYDDFIQNISFVTRLTVDTPDLGMSYVNWQNSLDTWFRLNDEVLSELKLASGELFKDDFERGVLYGGGQSSMSISRFFDFYGLPYGNAYGNSLFSARLKLDYEVKDIYRGYRLWPGFIKEFHFLMGHELLHADRVFLGSNLYSKETIQSNFVGTRLKTTLFYWVPTDIDLIFSSINKPTSGNINQISLLINTEAF